MLTGHMRPVTAILDSTVSSLRSAQPSCQQCSLMLGKYLCRGCRAFALRILLKFLGNLVGK